MSEYMAQWLNQTWIIVLAVISGVTSIWKFKDILKDMNNSIKTPLIKIDERLANLERSDRLTTEALLSLQRKSLLDSCQYYLSRGYASVEEKSTINSQYESYHDLGGDSFISEMVSQLNDLPTHSVNNLISKY